MTEYRPVRAKVFFVGFFGVFGLYGFAVSSLLVMDGVPAAVRVGYLLYVAAFALGIRWWLHRIAFSLTLDGNLLRWRAALRSGAIPLADLVVVRPSLRGHFAFEHTRRAAGPRHGCQGLLAVPGRTLRGVP